MPEGSDVGEGIKLLFTVRAFELHELWTDRDSSRHGN